PERFLRFAPDVDGAQADVLAQPIVEFGKATAAIGTVAPFPDAAEHRAENAGAAGHPPVQGALGPRAGRRIRGNLRVLQGPGFEQVPEEQDCLLGLAIGRMPRPGLESRLRHVCRSSTHLHLLSPSGAVGPDAVVVRANRSGEYRVSQRRAAPSIHETRRHMAVERSGVCERGHNAAPRAVRGRGRTTVWIAWPATACARARRRPKVLTKPVNRRNVLLNFPMVNRAPR